MLPFNLVWIKVRRLYAFRHTLLEKEFSHNSDNIIENLVVVKFSQAPDFERAIRKRMFIQYSHLDLRRHQAFPRLHREAALRRLLRRHRQPSHHHP